MGTYAEIVRLGALLDVFLIVYSVQQSFQSKPGITAIGMGFYPLPIEVEFLCVCEMSNNKDCVILISCGTYGPVQLHELEDCFIVSFPVHLLSSTGFGSLGNIHLKWGII